MIRFYGYKNCSSCRSAEKFLIEKNITYEFIDVTMNPPSASELKHMINISGIDLRKYLNTSGEVYRSLGLKDKIKAMTQDQVIELLATHGRLIKRPLITNGQRVTLGFREQELSIWT